MSPNYILFVYADLDPFLENKFDTFNAETSRSWRAIRATTVLLGLLDQSFISLCILLSQVFLLITSFFTFSVVYLSIENPSI